MFTNENGVKSEHLTKYIDLAKFNLWQGPLEYPRAFYHVINRGLERREIYRHPKDYEYFLGDQGNYRL